MLTDSLQALLVHCTSKSWQGLRAITSARWSCCNAKERSIRTQHLTARACGCHVQGEHLGSSTQVQGSVWQEVRRASHSSLLLPCGDQRHVHTNPLLMMISLGCQCNCMLHHAQRHACACATRPLAVRKRWQTAWACKRLQTPAAADVLVCWEGVPAYPSIDWNRGVLRRCLQHFDGINSAEK